MSALVNASESLKLEGNVAFKAGDYALAKQLYSKAIISNTSDDNATATLLCNKAACSLKLLAFDDCIVECSKALVINPSSTKALYRRSLAHEALKDFGKSVTDLTSLLRYDPKNSDAISMMRRVKALFMHEQSDSSQVKTIIDNMKKDEKQQLAGLKSLVGLTYDDKNHALDLARKGGLTWITQIINRELGALSDKCDVLLSAVRLLSACTNHVEFVRNYVDVGSDDETYFNNRKFRSISVGMTSSGKLSFVSLCSLMTCSDSTVVQIAVVLIMSILKLTPASEELLRDPKKKKSISSEESGASQVVVDADIQFTLEKPVVLVILTSFQCALRSCFEDIYSLITDSLSAFLSTGEDYFDRLKEVDTRLENLTERKLRLREQRILKMRSTNHTTWAIESGLLALLVEHVDCEQTVVRQNAANCLGKLINFFDNEAQIKLRLEPYLQGYDDEEVDDDLRGESKQRVVELRDDMTPPSVPQCRRRAALEAILLMSNPELGSWALALPGGVPQLLFLVATTDARCQEIAAEVMCLAASSDASSGQLSSIVSSGVLTTLMHSPYQGTRAAAASTITKLSLKAKALREDSAEIASVLNTVLGVLKTANQSSKEIDDKQSSVDDKKKKSKGSDQHLVSFSAMDEVGSSQQAHANRLSAEEKAHKPLSLSAGQISQETNAVTMTSVERAIEVLAALIGKTYVKEEIVHGSYRVAACISELTKLDLDVRSTAAYGLTHILAALTVTNSELHARALAEKDISPEQFQQMQELQRIKTKDDDGNVIEEKKDDVDQDSSELCRRRIQRLVACNGIATLVKYLTFGSNQTKEAAARTLRQICVDESSRGLMLQQGGFKACCNVAIDDGVQKTTRMECGHALSKTLVTSNPTLLTEHMRLGAIKPLVMMCRESESSNLQQFEALLALTNILSCGSAEHDRFAAEKGIPAVHYLIFSDNVMVRRAAMEALCNMPTHEGVLKLLRIGDKLKLWLGLSEDWENDTQDAHEAFLIARAAAGTLAGAASDPEVAEAMIQNDCARTIVALLDSQNKELVHRALVIVLELLSTDKRSVAEHLVTGLVVPAIGIVTRLNDPFLADLAMNCAQSLSTVMKNIYDSVPINKKVGQYVPTGWKGIN